MYLPRVIGNIASPSLREGNAAGFCRLCSNPTRTASHCTGTKQLDPGGFIMCIFVSNKFYHFFEYGGFSITSSTEQCRRNRLIKGVALSKITFEYNFDRNSPFYFNPEEQQIINLLNTVGFLVQVLQSNAVEIGSSRG